MSNLYDTVQQFSKRDIPDVFKTGTIGVDDARLSSQLVLVDFAVRWFEANRERYFYSVVAPSRGQGARNVRIVSRLLGSHESWAKPRSENVRFQFR